MGYGARPGLRERFQPGQAARLAKRHQEKGERRILHEIAMPAHPQREIEVVGMQDRYAGLAPLALTMLATIMTRIVRIEA